MILIYDKKVTANEAAKYLVNDMGAAADYWAESISTNFSTMTEKEQKEVSRLIKKHMERVEDFLKIHPIWRKIHHTK